jgi:hypothetical protein
MAKGAPSGPPLRLTMSRWPRRFGPCTWPTTRPMDTGGRTRRWCVAGETADQDHAARLMAQEGIQGARRRGSARPLSQTNLSQAALVKRDFAAAEPDRLQRPAACQPAATSGTLNADGEERRRAVSCATPSL